MFRRRSAKSIWADRNLKVRTLEACTIILAIIHMHLFYKTPSNHIMISYYGWLFISLVSLIFYLVEDHNAWLEFIIVTISFINMLFILYHHFKFPINYEENLFRMYIKEDISFILHQYITCLLGVDAVFTVVKMIRNTVRWLRRL